MVVVGSGRPFRAALGGRHFSFSCWFLGASFCLFRHFGNPIVQKIVVRTISQVYSVVFGSRRLESTLAAVESTPIHPRGRRRIRKDHNGRIVIAAIVIVAVADNVFVCTGIAFVVVSWLDLMVPIVSIQSPKLTKTTAVRAVILGFHHYTITILGNPVGLSPIFLQKAIKDTIVRIGCLLKTHRGILVVRTGKYFNGFGFGSGPSSFISSPCLLSCPSRFKLVRRTASITVENPWSQHFHLVWLDAFESAMRYVPTAKSVVGKMSWNLLFDWAKWILEKAFRIFQDDLLGLIWVKGIEGSGLIVFLLWFLNWKQHNRWC